MKSSFFIGSLISAVALLPTLWGCSSSADSEPLKIAYLPITHALPLFEAAEVANADSSIEDVELVRFSSWTELSDALNTGGVDGAVILAPMAIRAAELGTKIHAIALGHRDGNVVVAANDVLSANDLRGRTIAIPHRLSSHNLLLDRLLEFGGLSLSDVDVTELPPPEMPAALAEGRIAAYIVAEPFGAKGVTNGSGHVLYTSPELWNHSVCCTLVLRDDALKNKPSQSQHFAQLYKEAGDILTKNKNEAERIAQAYLKVDKQTLQKSLEWISFNDLNLRRSDYDELRTWLQESNLSNNPPTFDAFVDTTTFR